MEKPRKIWRKIVEYSSSFWCSYPFGLRALILNWSNSRKYVLGEDWLCSSKKMAPVLGNKAVPFLRKSATDSREIRHRFWGNPSPTLKQSVTDFGEICHRFWGNPSPILRKSVTDFGETRHRFLKSTTDFGKNLPQTLGKSATDFGKLRFCYHFWEKHAPFEKNRVRF